jgi:hypothetical protein
MEQNKKETLTEKLNRFLESKKYPTWFEIAIIGVEYQEQKQKNISIEFGDWLVIQYNEDTVYPEHTTEELFEIFKKEKGL